MHNRSYNHLNEYRALFPAQGIELQPEAWVSVLGFPGYEVSTLGRFRSKDRGKFLYGTLSANGYVHIGLVLGCKQVWKLAHRLVAASFLVQPSQHHSDVNHGNKVRFDNRLANLQWVTRSENSIHAKKNNP